ncbi:TPA: hypothetical protein H1016_05495 [archaeon]|uniref:Carbohydrate-binding domain-containing protein n=1 Tax=Candidatus Naiadarchaeum limnaeum TaxID=2756139 RepID=A0A832V4V6_9ARCH|nr:hypothetical protein [Candidatus Naiadarchaeum limnaeum]
MAKESIAKNKLVLAILLVVLAVALVVYINSTTGFLTFGPVVRAPEKQTTLTSYLGGAPILDGQISSLDNWNEAVPSTITYERGTVKIASKHDLQYIYFLVQWDDDGPAWNDAINFYFEDDGVTHDHSLDGKYDYSFRNLIMGCNVIAGGYWTAGANDWTPAGADFDVRCNHEKRRWTMEVRHVLFDLLRGDKVFRIEPGNEEILGMAMVNWEENSMGGSGWQSWNWPIDAKAGTYFGTNPAEPATWGDLKVVWTRKVK